MSKIELSKVNFTYPGSSEPVLEDFSVTLDTTWKTGLIGRNGRGKTTLLTLLSGKNRPDSGKVALSCPAKYFPPAVEDTDLTGEELFSTLTLGCPEWKFRRELNLLGMGEDVLYRPFYTLSGGEQTKLLLGALFCQEEGFLLIDEPTNHLDGQGRETVARYLKGKSGFVLVSHDRDFLDGCVDHILALNPTGPELQAGNFSSWWENKQRRDQFELEQNQTLKKEIKKLNQSARQTREWADRAEGAKIGFDPRTTEKSIGRRPAQGAKAKKRMARAKDTLEKTQRKIRQKEALLQDLETAAPLKLTPLPWRGGRLVLLHQVQLFYGTEPVCRPLDLELCPGDRVAVVGANGSGKSTLLKLLQGQSIQREGLFRCSPELKVSYLPQDCSGLSGFPEDLAEQWGIDKTKFFTLLKKLDLTPDTWQRPMEGYSLGQKKKVMLAASLCENAHLYLWDEPLNYIDLWSRMQIEQLILESCPTIVFVEHDRAFCRKLATKTLRLD